jgi:cyclopropane-fatty-acyl-phospholipid synthase
MTQTTAPLLLAWPDLDPAPSGGFSARIARRLFRSAVSRLDVTVHLHRGDGTIEQLGRGGPAIVVRRPDEFFARLGRDQLIGFGEAYMTGAWCEDGTPGDGVLGDFLTVLAAELPSLVPPSLQRLRSLVVTRIPRTQRGTRENTQSNVAHHYDLSNDLFAAFLDPTMSYSSALFEDDRPFAEQDLAASQLRKIDAILDLAEVRAGSRVLEIGTGWGALAIEAAGRGATVTTVTLSTEQAELARERADRSGVGDRIDIRIQDYREVTGSYDAVVSVEMIEAVGEDYWPTYFAALDRLLAPGGVAAIQAILMEHDRFLATRRSYGWIQKHIFPGGMIPSLESIRTTTQRHTELRVDRVHRFGRHYAETLRRWRETFDAIGDLGAIGFDETFRRKWDFYLAYCEAGFQSRYLDVAQIRMTRG